MNFFDVFQLISLILFLSIFIGRSVWLHRTGTQIFVIGKGKSGFKAVLEIIFIGVLVIWIYEIYRHSVGISFSPIPEFLSKVLFESIFLKITGVILIIPGLTIFIFALIAFG
ncbi:MAG: hypothetical protein HQ541_11050, partial [Mariniphaga sp.]|nr:hypothetical protein [Mariniphaga sp.]